MNLNVQQKRSIFDVDNKSLTCAKAGWEGIMLEIWSIYWRKKIQLKAKLTISFTAKKKMNSMFWMVFKEWIKLFNYQCHIIARNQLLGTKVEKSNSKFQHLDAKDTHLIIKVLTFHFATFCLTLVLT